MKKNLFVVGVLFFLSCEHKSKTSRYRLSDSYEKVSKTKDVNYLIEYSKKLPCVCSISIGIEGSYNPDGEYFKRLNELASDSLLIELTRSSSPNLRISSFWELESRKSKKLPQLIELLSNDTSEVCVIDGDIKIHSTIGQLVQVSKSK